jgi:hypothetical protein
VIQKSVGKTDENRRPSVFIIGLDPFCARISADGPQCRSPRPTASRLPSVASRKRCPSEVGRAALQLDRAPYTEYARPHQACTLGRAR